MRITVSVSPNIWTGVENRYKGESLPLECKQSDYYFNKVVIGTLLSNVPVLITRLSRRMGKVNYRQEERFSVTSITMVTWFINLIRGSLSVILRESERGV